MCKFCGNFCTLRLLVFSTLLALCCAAAWNFTEREGVTYDTQLRAAVSDCFSHSALSVHSDDTIHVIDSDVKLTPSDWWPPGPITVNMIQVLTKACRSLLVRIRINSCIKDIYLSATTSSDLQVNMALAHLPLPEAWLQVQDHICSLSDLTEDLPCLAHLQFSLHRCVASALNNSHNPALVHHRFLACRQMAVSVQCQRHVYRICSLHTSQTLSAVTALLTPALCVPHISATVNTSGHVVSRAEALWIIVLCRAIFPFCRRQ